MTNDSGALETDGARMYYEVEGSGEPVVMVHAGVANLRGLSRGAQIALDFVLEFPDRARSLVFASGGVGGYDAGDEAPRSPPAW